jgi:hypothetical protein
MYRLFDWILVDDNRYVACQSVIDGTGSGSVESSRERLDSHGVPSIRDLICAALGAGKTVRQLEDDSGGLVRFQTFQELANHAPKQFPKDPKTITGMAAALNVPESTVVLAYATGLGIDVHNASSNFTLRLPPGLDRLDPVMQDALITLARAAVKTQKNLSDDAQAGLTGLARLEDHAEALRVQNPDHSQKKRS